MVQSYVVQACFWASGASEITVGTAWKDFGSVPKVPALGEKGWHERRKTFRVCFDFKNETRGAVCG